MSQQMDRNVNLEEYDNTGFMNIDYFRYQTVKQKAILYVSAGIAIVIVLAVNILYPKYQMFGVVAAAPILGLGGLFSSNFNQDLTMLQYLKLKLRPSVYVTPLLSTEDPMYVRGYFKEVPKEELVQQSPAEYAAYKKKVIRLLIIGVVGFFILMIGIVVFFLSHKESISNDVHHTVSMMIDQAGVFV